MEWLQLFQRALNLESIEAPVIKVETVTRTKWDKNRKQRITKARSIRKQVNETLKGEDSWDFLMDCMRDFCSYIKHGERGKLKRRAIASAGMAMRM